MKNLFRILRYDWPLHFILLFTNWFPDNVVILRFRGCIAKPFFNSCGKNLRLGRNVTFYNPSNLTIRNNVFIAYGTWISAATDITIEDEVTIGPYCVITSSNHKRVDNSYFQTGAETSPIRLNAGSWIGAHCVVTAGCEIGPGSVLGAGSVCITNIQENVLAVGIPARPIKTYKNPQ